MILDVISIIYYCFKQGTTQLLNTTKHSFVYPNKIKTFDANYIVNKTFEVSRSLCNHNNCKQLLNIYRTKKPLSLPFHLSA